MLTCVTHTAPLNFFSITTIKNLLSTILLNFRLSHQHLKMGLSPMVLQINVSVAVICLLMSSLLIQQGLAGKARHHRWEVEYMFWSPDCVEGVVMGINGQFPGPTLRARAGDTIVVELRNKLHTEGVVIHWHGIRQLGTPWSDGTASISQCAINPGEAFTYRFTVDKPGTYFYHGHLGMQRSAGLYGSLIVDVAEGEKEPFHYDGEFNILLSDWWHNSSLYQEVALSAKPFRWIGEPQTLLINGRGQYNCSLAAHFSDSSSSSQCQFSGREQCAPEILTVLPNKTYRLRVASSTALASLSLSIKNHKMVVVEADGNYVQPFAVEDMDIYSGESYSVLFTTNQLPTDNYWISVSVRGRQPKTPQGLAILKYLPNSSSKLPSLPPPIAPLWNDYTHSMSFSTSVLALMGSQKPPTNFHRRIILLNTQNTIDGFTKWAINNISLSLPSTPYLGSMKFNFTYTYDSVSPPENYPQSYDIMNPGTNTNSTTGNGVYVFEYNTTVDVILQNANTLLANTSEIHPWHLHGHDFWVLGYGEGKFIGKKHEKLLNLNNPPLRNTAVIFPYGWTALRFVADNPGVWAFHCHIEPHLHMGMGVVFAEGVNFFKNMNIPSSALSCGLTAKVFIDKYG